MNMSENSQGGPLPLQRGKNRKKEEIKNGGSWSHVETLRGAGVILGISLEPLEAILMFVQVFTGQVEGSEEPG